MASMRSLCSPGSAAQTTAVGRTRSSRARCRASHVCSTCMESGPEKMATAVIVGGGVAGLTGALALRPLGYDVGVLDRDPAPAPVSVERANVDWLRPSAPQTL